MSTNLRPAIASGSVEAPSDTERLHPLLYPLAAYLAIGTLVLFLVAQLDALGAYIAPWSAERNRWHEGSAGWMALFPLATPFLLVHGLSRLSLAIPARLLELAGRIVMRIGAHVVRAWSAVRAAIVRARIAMQAMLHDAMRAVRRSAELTVRRVRAALGRLTAGR